MIRAKLVETVTRKVKTKPKDTGKSRVPALVGLMAGLLVLAVGWLKEGYEVRSEIREKLGDAAGSEKDAEEAKKLISHMDL